jgi:hypothetical protein
VAGFVQLRAPIDEMTAMLPFSDPDGRSELPEALRSTDTTALDADLGTGGFRDE